jgi:hypothetical protein
MIRLAFALTLIAVSICAHGATTFECETKRPNEKVFNAIPRFTFTIERAPDVFRPTAFRLCDAVGASPFLLVKMTPLVGKKGHPKVGTPVVRRIELTEERHAQLLAKYDAALSINFKDETFGLDGSEWCLDAQRGGNSIKACFWTPPEQPEKRGIAPFQALGEALWKLADFGDTNGQLM